MIIKISREAHLALYNYAVERLPITFVPADFPEIDVVLSEETVNSFSKFRLPEESISDAIIRLCGDLIDRDNRVSSPASSFNRT